ncbi:MAG: MinD-like ATPase involved in chromosome partitioning or flagellar assembly [Pseudonocardiales bacterium]|nr:MinD-like ATPase involved in chromosome partitioning or flagellar assembly [Pseudonocardiales bacterium]
MTHPPSEEPATWMWDPAGSSAPDDDPQETADGRGRRPSPTEDWKPHGQLGTEFGETTTFSGSEAVIAPEPPRPSYQLPDYLREPIRFDDAPVRISATGTADTGTPTQPAAEPARLNDLLGPAGDAVERPTTALSELPGVEPRFTYPAPEYPVDQYPAEPAPADPSSTSSRPGSPYATYPPGVSTENPAPQPFQQLPESVPLPAPLPAPRPAPRPAPLPTPAPVVTEPAQPIPPPRPESLLAPNPSPVTSEPATWGWRGSVRRLSAGLIKPQPGPDELADRAARLAIQHSFSRPMTIVVITPKGGAGKTPTTIGLASALGSHRGGYVVGWDDNETRGTLAVRIANPDSQRTTVWDLLGALPMFERPDARVGDLSQFVRSQGEAQFDALVSDDNPSNMAQIGDQEFHRIHAVLQRFYRQIVIDTGNNVRSLNWQAAVNAADLVVVVTSYQRDVAYSGSWVLDHLTETGREHLANTAITVLTSADHKPDPTVRSELLAHFGARTRAVVEIPYDPVIALGGPMEWRLLKPATQRAWTRAGAAVVSALAAKEDRDDL